MLFEAKHSQEKRYYVYQYNRTHESKNGLIGSPHYIGKGQGYRAYENKSHFVKPPKEKSKIKIVSKNMNEADAFQLEILLIHLYGRIDIGTGCLRNRTNGGDNPPAMRNKTSFKKGQPSLRKGVKHTPETIEKCKAYWSDVNRKKIGNKIRETAKNRTPEEKEKIGKKISDLNKGHHYSPATQFKKGVTSWNKGISATEKRKAHLLKQAVINGANRNGRICVHKNNIKKYIEKIELQTYLDNGFIKGQPMGIQSKK